MTNFRVLLICGVIAGPLYVLVAGAQALMRDGFDITRHPVSLLSNGDLGWIQILNFVVVGILVIATAVGVRSASDPGASSAWGSRLLGINGAGLVASGIFVADPSHGFPPGTPSGNPETVTFSGVMHFMAGGVAFLALIAACFLFARYFYRSGELTWMAFSVVTGIVFFVSFGMTAVFAGAAAANLLLTFAVILGWAWLSAFSLRAFTSATGTSKSAIAFG
jgi:hypothetical protein